MNFYITFGQQYRANAHPKGGHPDGWIRIIADSENEARAKAFAEFGEEWSMIYPESKFDPKYFPKGELGLFVHGPFNKGGLKE